LYGLYRAINPLPDCAVVTAAVYHFAGFFYRLNEKLSGSRILRRSAAAPG
jgi:hypothetical protein